MRIDNSTICPPALALAKFRHERVNLPVLADTTMEFRTPSYSVGRRCWPIDLVEDHRHGIGHAKFAQHLVHSLDLFLRGELMSTTQQQLRLDHLLQRGLERID